MNMKLYEPHTVPKPYSNMHLYSVIVAWMAYKSVSAIQNGMTRPEEVPIWHKYSLSYSEAAAYFGIGEKRLRQLVSEHPNSDFILEIGTHIRFKRTLLEDYLNTVGCV